MEQSRFEEISNVFPGQDHPAPVSPQRHAYPTIPQVPLRPHVAPVHPEQTKKKKNTRPARVALTMEEILLLMSLTKKLMIDLREFRTYVGHQSFPNRAFHNATYGTFEQASLTHATLQKMQEYFLAAYTECTEPTEELRTMMSRVLHLGREELATRNDEFLALHFEEDSTPGGQAPLDEAE